MGHSEIRVAILEDQRLMLETLERLLTANGLSVVLASTRPAEFLEALPSAGPTLALIDLYLPSVTEPGLEVPRRPIGLDVIHELHLAHPELSLLAISGNASEEELRAAQEAGAVTVLDKNVIGPEQLLAAVRSTLRAQRSELPPELGEAPLSDSSHLTHRELQVLKHLATGADNLKIAAHLGITERTVRAHVSALYRKLQCENRTEMAVLARTMGIRFSELEV